MRTRHLYSGLVMAAAALLCLAGCKKDDEGEKIMLGTQFEKSVSAQKTYLGDGNVLYWSANDSVFVNGVKYKGISSEGIAVTEDEHYYAVYPATTGNSVDANGGTVEIPAVQIYHTENGKQVIDGPMAARLDAAEGTLHFKNLYSLLKVTVSADDKAFTVNHIMVSVTGSGARALAGSYNFTFSEATAEESNTAPAMNAAARTDKDSSTRVTLNSSTGIEVPANTDKDFYIVVHPFVGQNLKVDVQGMLEGKSAIYTHTTATTVGLSRSRIGGLGINLQQLNPVLRGIGEFTVNASGDKVTFSPGNLQYRASLNGTAGDLTHTTTDGLKNGRFRFAEHQYDFVGGTTDKNSITVGNVYEGGVRCSNNNIGETYTGWIDLFGYGTSGYKYSNPYFYEPWSSNNEHAKYLNHDAVSSYALADWGQYNAIYNPQTEQMDAAGTWRLLTYAEFKYLLQRKTVNKFNVDKKGSTERYLYAGATYHGVKGLAIFPDDWENTPYAYSGIWYGGNIQGYSFQFTEETEAAGAIFLPISGIRLGKIYKEANYNAGEYMTSTVENGKADDLHYAVYHMAFGYLGNWSIGGFDPKISDYCINWQNPEKQPYTGRASGLSVRLVKDVK